MNTADHPVIGVVGLGTMGQGIVQVFAAAGFAVLATDAGAVARDKARSAIAAALDRRVAAGKISAAARDATLSGITILPDLADFAPATLIVEAIVEDATAKQTLFAQLERLVSPTTILATNTSSLSVGAVAAPLAHPGRVLGLHFFNPPAAMRLTELVAGPATSVAALALARQITERAGKTVIQCPDRPGFIVNRCARPYYGEALAMLEAGFTAHAIDGAMVAAGYPLGPFSLIDLIGADINLAATTGIYAAMADHPRYFPFAALADQVASAKFGRKSGAGFLWPDVPLPQPNPDLVQRIESTLINEACFLAAEGVPPADIDTAMTLGLNFPHGPFAALRHHGKAAILARLDSLETAAPPALKQRYRPAPYLTAS